MTCLPIGQNKQRLQLKARLVKALQVLNMRKYGCALFPCACRMDQDSSGVSKSLFQLQATLKITDDPRKNCYLLIHKSWGYKVTYHVIHWRSTFPAFNGWDEYLSQFSNCASKQKQCGGPIRSLNSHRFILRLWPRSIPKFLTNFTVISLLLL